MIKKIYRKLRFYLWFELSRYVIMLFNPNIKIGKKSRVVKPFIEKEFGGEITIGTNCVIRKWTCFMPYGGEITIGNNTSINSFCHLNGCGGLKIGNDVRIAAHCMLIPANHNFDDVDKPIYLQGQTQKGIVIEDDVWLGAGVKVLDGVTIGKGSVIGAGSVVSKTIPPYSIAVGVPAKVIRSRK